MLRALRKSALMGALAALPLTSAATAAPASKPSAESALKQLRPVQDGVDYDTPEGEGLKQATIAAEKLSETSSGWIIRDGQGQLLRRFLDTNNDNRVDQWCYYRQGVEVYRDIDRDYNGRADEYRWLGTAGLRWGLDRDEDRTVDSWKAISAEEVSAEVVEALRQRDAGRFERLLLTTEELDQLQLGKRQHDQLAEKIAAAPGQFRQLLDKQQLVTEKTRWVNFGGSAPGLVPAGTEGSEADLIVYDNVAAVIENGGEHGQVAIGTLVQVGKSWRLIDVPSNLLENQVAQGGYFFEAPLPQAAGGPEGALGGPNQELIAALEKVDRKLAQAGPGEIGQLNAERAKVLRQLVDKLDGNERSTWLRQLADTISGAVQSGASTDGVGELKQMVDQLRQSDDALNLPYVEFRYISAAYTAEIQQPKADFAKIQDSWVDGLKQFVGKYPQSEEAAEAMLQLAMALEFSGDDKEAIAWYSRVAKDFPEANLAKKAAGAKRRLEAVGQVVSLAGTSTRGESIDLQQFRGKMVLIHYWATWCEPCKRDMEELKRLQAKFAGKGFQLIGISLDSDRQQLDEFLRQRPMSWPQLHEEGGLESRYANEMGILTLPTMLLVDSRGRVVNRNIHAGEVEEALNKAFQQR